MPTPKIWDKADTLVSDLKKNWNARVMETSDAEADWEGSIRSAVGSNTFRAFANLPNQPSRVFRDWAYDALITRGHFTELKQVLTQADYDKWLQKLVSDFARRWRKQMKCSIPFGPSYKLPNLLMKAVYLRLPRSHRQRIVRFLHIPLDRYTLVGIRNCITLPDGRMIPKSATMRFVRNDEVYKAVQQRIETLASKAGVPMIAYDYLAWDTSH